MSEEAKSNTSIQALKNPEPREQGLADIKIDMFSLRGFELAQRIAKAFATSDAVPAIFRSHTSKKSGNGDITWVENPSALGNCLVAIETAQAVGMSVTAVMQNANVIEGRLSWSGKFIIAAVNASRRFSPLRFHIVNKGKIKATYKEKGAWNNANKRYDMTEKSIEIDNIECTAWAFAMEGGRTTRDVIEGTTVSMKMSVEEGWYAKPGSKWQTELRNLMLTYRAGAYFGNIHAPDVVMGMGKTSEEHEDIVDIFPQADGKFSANLDELRSQSSTPPLAKRDNSSATEVHENTASTTGQDDIHEDTEASGSAQTGTVAGSTNDTNSQASDSASAAPADNTETQLSFAKVADSLNKATDMDVLEVAAELIPQVASEEQRIELNGIYKDCKKRLTKPKARAAAADPGVSME